MVMPVPNHVSQTPGAGESAKIRSTLEQLDTFAVLRQTVSDRHAEDSTADDGP